MQYLEVDLLQMINLMYDPLKMVDQLIDNFNFIF